MIDKKNRSLLNRLKYSGQKNTDNPSHTEESKNTNRAIHINHHLHTEVSRIVHPIHINHHLHTEGSGTSYPIYINHHLHTEDARIGYPIHIDNRSHTEDSKTGYLKHLGMKHIDQISDFLPYSGHLIDNNDREIRDSIDIKNVIEILKKYYKIGKEIDPKDQPMLDELVRTGYIRYDYEFNKENLKPKRAIKITSMGEEIISII